MRHAHTALLPGHISNQSSRAQHGITESLADRCFDLYMSLWHNVYPRKWFTTYHSDRPEQFTSKFVTNGSDMFPRIGKPTHCENMTCHDESSVSTNR